MSIRRRSSLVFLVVLALLLAIPGSALAGATKTGFTGSEVWVADLAPGVESFPDGQYHVRGALSRFAFEATDPRLAGATNDITINWNFTWMPEPVVVSGPMWGTFVLTNAGGSWEGSWTGVRDENGFSYFHFVGKGAGGYEGLQLRMWGERLTPDPSAPEMYQGYILDPGK